jgi:hypothetical protein
MLKHKPSPLATVHEVREAAPTPYGPAPAVEVEFDTALHARLIREKSARPSTYESATAALQRLRKPQRSA